MTTYYLRPNADISSTGSWSTFGSGASKAARLADESNSTGVQSNGSSERTQVFGLQDWSGIIPADQIIVAVTPYMIFTDSRSGIGPTSAFSAAVGIFHDGYALQEGATYVSKVGTKITVKGPRCTTRPGDPTTYWSYALLDSLKLQIKSRKVTDYYEAWVAVETISAGTVDVTAPTGTIAQRGPVIQWNYSLGQEFQGQALVKIFDSATYTGMGFDPNTATPIRTANIYDTAGSWDVYYTQGGVEYGQKLDDGSYRAYVWVKHVGLADWYGPDYVTFTVADDPSVPTSLTPVDGATITTGVPTISAIMAAQAGGATKRCEFQIASNEDFDTDLQTFLVEPPSLSGTITYTLDAAEKLIQGAWFIRVRALDEFANYSAWSATNGFTVAHQPAASALTPSLGAVSIYTGTKDLAWTFTDPSSVDVQTAYQVQVGIGSDPTPTVDSGTVTSADEFYTATLDVTHKNVLLWWRVRVKDEDGVWSPWAPQAVFALPEAITATITTPAESAVVTTPTPSISWSFSASGGRVQAAWRAYIVNEDTSTTVADSGWVNGVETDWTPPVPVVDLGVNYSANIELRDNLGTTGTDLTNFTASYTLPPAVTFTLVAATYEVDGLVALDWPTGTPDSNFVAWRVYRRVVGGGWTLVREITDETTLAWDDYTAPSNTDLEYAVVQAARRIGLVVESPYEPQAFSGDNAYYMLVAPDDPTLNCRLFSVKADSFVDEIETAVIKVIGRGRVVRTGTRYGKEGQIELTFYDTATVTAREQRLAIEALRESGYTVYLRNPFGDVWPVNVIDMNFTRMAGVGNREYGTGSITYTEVAP